MPDTLVQPRPLENFLSFSAKHHLRVPMQRAQLTVHSSGPLSHQHHDTFQQSEVYRTNSVCAHDVTGFCHRGKYFHIDFRYLAPKRYLTTVHSLYGKLLCFFCSCLETVNELRCRIVWHNYASGDVSVEELDLLSMPHSNQKGLTW